MKKLTTLRTVFLILIMLFLKIDLLKGQNINTGFPKYGGVFHYEYYNSQLNQFDHQILSFRKGTQNWSDTLGVFKRVTGTNLDTLAYVVIDTNKVLYSLNGLNGQYQTLYDFTLEIGDTAYYDSLIQEPAIVNEIYNIDNRKIMILNNGDSWEYGIGSVKHPFRLIKDNYIKDYNICYMTLYFNDSISHDYSYNTSWCVTSSEYLMNSYNFKIFPNPLIDNQLNIQSDENIFMKSISIYDLSGKQVFAQNINSLENNINLTLPNLPNGMYIVHIDTEKGQINKKVNVLNHQ